MCCGVNVGTFMTSCRFSSARCLEVTCLLCQHFLLESFSPSFSALGPLTGKSGQMFLTVTFCVCQFLFFFLLILLSYVVVFDGKLLILIKWLHSIDEGVGWLMKVYINYTTGSSFHSFFVELKCFCILNVVVFTGVFVFFTPNTLGFVMIWTVTVCVILFLELKRKTNFGVAQATLLFRGEKKKSWFLVVCVPISWRQFKVLNWPLAAVWVFSVHICT